MEKKHIVDMHAWPRQEHYRYFGELDDPYFGITAKADFTSCYMQFINPTIFERLGYVFISS